MPYLALITLFIAVAITLLFLREAGITGLSVSNESAESLGIEFGLVQQQAEVGLPVKWVKTIETSSLSLGDELPPYATNYVVEELRDGSFIAVSSGPAPMRAEEVASEEMRIYRIEYETPAPQKSEIVISDKVKQVLVTSDVDYTDVLVSTQVDEVPKGAIRVYWLVESDLPGSEPEELPISDYVDNDADGLIDEIEWIAPHLSNQTFEVRIDILNVQSYPVVGGEWVVDFTTAGSADLTITAVDNTTFGTDLDFISLKCGDTVLGAVINNNTISYPDYECNDTGHETSLVLTPGSHHLMFQFGDEVEYAHNYAVVSEGSTLINAYNVYYEIAACSSTNPANWCAITNYGAGNANYSGEMNFSTSTILNKNITSASVCMYQYFGSLQYTTYAENLTSITCAGNPLTSGLQQTTWFAQGWPSPLGWYCADVTDFVRNAVDRSATSFNVRIWGEDIASASAGYDCFRGPASAVANCGGANPSGAANCTPYLNVTYDTISGDDDRLYPTKNKGVYNTGSSATTLYMGDYSTNYMMSLYEFDLSAYEGKSIGGAHFYCRVNSGTGLRGIQNITAYRITQDWTEANATNLTTAPTYSTATAYGGRNIPDDAGGRYHWDITTLVRAWLDGTYTNEGFVLRQTDAVDAVNNYTYCYSRTAASVPDRPYLEVYSADCLVPYNDLTIRSDVTFCPGTYYLNDSGSNGVIIVGANNINITCNGTIFVGNTSNYGLYSGSDNNIVVRGCTFNNYTYGMYLSTSDDWLIENDTFMYNNGSTYTYGIYLSNSNRINVTDCNFTNNSIGIGAFLTNDARITESVFDGNDFQGIRTSGNRSIILGNTFNGRGLTDNLIHMFNSPPNNCERFVIANNTMTNATSYALYIQTQALATNITNNTIGNNSNYAIYLGASTNTTLVWNNDLSRSSGVILYNGNASSEFNYTTIGNHWSSYDRPAEGCYDDVMPGGICDSPLPMANIDGVDINTDNFPLAYSPTGGCVVPVDNLVLVSDTSLCYGRYEINDSDSVGIVKFGATGVDVTCDETRIIGNTSGRGFSSSYSTSSITGCNVSKYLYNYLFTGSSNRLISSISMLASASGVYMSGSNNNISSLFSYNDSTAFLEIVGSYNNMTNSAIYYPTAYGLSLQGNANNSFFMNVNVTNSSSATDISLAQALNNTFRNCTLYGNDAASYGIGLALASTGNLFYHNNISGTYNLYATSTRSENSFNTTVGGKAQGNFWGDVASLDIIDFDSDGFGDAGSKYPYNSTYSTKVNVNVTDWGPITSKNCTAPSDGLVISRNTRLCSGTYFINDTGSNGLITFGANDVLLVCDNTVLDGDATGRAFQIANRKGLNITGCTIKDYDYGIYVTGGTSFNSSYITNNTFEKIDLFSIASDGGNTLNYITIDNNTFLDGSISSTYVIYLLSDVNSSRFSNNYLRGASGDRGLYTNAASRNNNITNNTFNMTDLAAVYLYPDTNMFGNRIWRNRFHGGGIELTASWASRSSATITNNSYCVGGLGNAYFNGSAYQRPINDCGPFPNVAGKVLTVNHGWNNGWSWDATTNGVDVNMSNIADAMANVPLGGKVNVTTAGPYVQEIDAWYRDNVTLDCNNVGRIDNNAASGTGTEIKYINNFTLQNCTIDQFFYGIYADYAMNSSFLNNSFSGSIRGFELTNSDKNRIQLNKFTTMGGNLQIYFSGYCDNNMISNNSFYDNNDDYPMYIYSSSLGASNQNNNITNNTFNTSIALLTQYYNRNNIWRNIFYRNGVYMTADLASRTADEVVNNSFCYNDGTGIVGNAYLEGAGEDRPPTDCGPFPTATVIAVNNSRNNAWNWRGTTNGVDINFSNVRDALANVPYYGLVNITTAGPYAEEADIWRLDNITLDCNSIGRMDNNAATGYGLEIRYLQNFTVKNCTIDDFAYGFFASYMMNSSLLNNTVSGAAQHDMYLYASDQNIIDRSRFYSTDTVNGVHMYIDDNCDRNSVQNCQFHDSTGDVAILFDNYDSRNNNITNNTFNVTGDRAIYVGDTIVNTTIWRNDFLTLFNPAITMYNASTRLNYTNIGNFWAKYDGQSEGCYDLAPADGTCDAQYQPDTSIAVYDYFPQAHTYYLDYDCGEPLSASLTMSANIKNCTGGNICPQHGYLLGANNLVLNCSANNITGVNATQTYGVYVGAYSNLTLNNCSIRGFNYGIAFNNTNNSRINFTSVNGTSKAGVWMFNSADNNTVTNSSFTFNYVGINLSGATNMLFYYNNISNSTRLQASSTDASNRFNTTNDTCGVRCARGNYWSDSSALQIFDMNSDGYGDFGVQYPYNSTNGANVSVNVNDWGPRTILTPDCVEPYDNLTVESNITLCAGTYYVTDTTADGAIFMGADGYWVNCTGTVLVGNGSGYGFYIYGENVHVNGCRITNYSMGIRHGTSYDPYFEDLEIYNNTEFGIYASTSGIMQLDNVSIHHNTGDGISLQTAGINVSTNLTLFNNGGYGLYTLFIYYINASNIVAYNNTLDGIALVSSPNATISNVISHHNGDDGVSLNLNSGNSTIYDVTSYGNVNYGIDVSAGDTNVSSVTSYNNSYGLVVGSLRVSIFNTTATNNTYSGLLIMGNNHTVWNCTFDNNEIGADISANLSLFYYNNFLNNTHYHARSDAGYENQFNTSVSGSARGNYWKGVTDLKIYDTDGNGFGDLGLQYPYNSTNGGNTTGPVTDWGPITTKTNYRIQPPILFTPTDDAIVTDSRNPLYGWTNPDHTLSDSVTYNIQVDDDVNFLSPAINIVGIAETAISTYYWSSALLAFSKDYYWRVLANDTYNVSLWSSVFNFTILPTVSCTEPVDEVDFGVMCIFENQTTCDTWPGGGLGSHTNDTLDNHPPPYVVENDGNLNSSGEVYSTSLWESNTYRAMPSKYYQFMIGINESGSYEWALDSAWVNMTNVSADAPLSLYGFKWANSSDAFNLHINLTSPTDEPPGYKYSTTYVTCIQNETV
jgi:parallel beta-helix repeat protein